MAGRELQPEVSPLDGIVIADLSRLLDAQDLAPGAGGIADKAEPACAGATAKRSLWAAIKVSASHRPNRRVDARAVWRCEAICT